MAHPYSTTDVPLPLWLCTEEGMLSLESSLDDGRGGGVWPRVSKDGKIVRSWDRYRQQAMNEIDRRLRSRRDTSERFEIGRLSIRSRDSLRYAADCFALHFLFVDADQQNDDRLARKAAYYWERAGSALDAETTAGLDYDRDRSGTFDDSEKELPFPMRMLRG